MSCIKQEIRSYLTKRRCLYGYFTAAWCLWCGWFNKGRQSQFPLYCLTCMQHLYHYTSTHLHVCCTKHQYERQSSWKIPTCHIAAVLALVPAEKTEPLECAHRVHTPAGLQHWAESSGGRLGWEQRGGNEERPEGAHSCWQYATFMFKWHCIALCILYISVYVCIVAVILWHLSSIHTERNSKMEKTTHLRSTGLVKQSMLWPPARQPPTRIHRKKGQTHAAQYPGRKLQQVALLRWHWFKLVDRLQHCGGGRFVLLHYQLLN